MSRRLRSLDRERGGTGGGLFAAIVGQFVLSASPSAVPRFRRLFTPLSGGVGTVFRKRGRYSCVEEHDRWQSEEVGDRTGNGSGSRNPGAKRVKWDQDNS